MDMFTDAQKNFAKKFFDKPEGKLGMVILAGVIVGGFIGLWHLLPWIITLLQNLWTAIALAVGVGATLYVLFDRRFRMLVSYAYQSIMRGITGIFVELNPIAIIRIYIDKLRKYLDDMDRHMGNLRGQINTLKQAIEENKRTITDSMKIASKAKEQGKQLVMQAYSRKAGRRTDSLMEYKTLLEKIEKLYNIIAKMKEVSEFVVEDLEDDVDTKIRKYKIIKETHSAFRSAMSIIKGNPNERAMFEQALAFIENDVAMKVGEIERFIEISGNVIESVDIQNGVYIEEGFKLLEEYEKDGLAKLLGEFETSSSGKSVDEMSPGFAEMKKEFDFQPVSNPGQDTTKGKYFDFNSNS